MIVWRKLGWFGVLATGLLALPMTPNVMLAEEVRLAQEELDQGMQRSNQEQSLDRRRWRRARWYAVVTVYNTTNRPVHYQIQYTSHGGYYDCVVPAHGWCCHWTTSADADYRIVVNGRTLAVSANWVCLIGRPCHSHGTPVSLGGSSNRGAIRFGGE